jgi:hypothetical protein
VPHAPQFASSVPRFTHAPEQLVSPVAHDAVHAEALQTWPAAHAIAHPPQCIGSERVSTHAPAQLVCIAAQLHVPLTHVAPPEHVTPHAPQFAGSL